MTITSRLMRLLLSTTVLLTVLLVPQLANATTTVSKPVYADGQCIRTITTVENKWTPYRYISGQPSKGTYLTKGDFLYYSPSSGSNATVSINIGYQVGSVSLTVPLGKLTNGSYGKGLIAKSKGYYRIRARKYVRVTIRTVQTCGTAGYCKPNNKWRTCSKYKSYKTLKTYSHLIKQ